MTQDRNGFRLALQCAAFALATSIASPALAVSAADLEVGRWVAVSSNTVASVSACPGDGCGYSGNEGLKGIMDDWTGGAFATNLGASGSLLVFGGGHSGYLGNEVYAFDVAQGSWSRLTNPVNPPTCDYNTSTMAGNSPCSAHMYEALEYSPVTNEFVKLGSSSDGSTVEGTAFVHALNLQTKQWRRGAKMPTWDGVISDDGEGASTAWDPVRNVIWWHGSWRAAATSNKVLRKYDPAANTWTEYPGKTVGIDQAGAFDSQRQIFLVVDGRDTKSVYAYDTSVETPVLYTLSTTGDLAAQQASAIGLDYDPVTDQFVAWTGGSAVYTLKAPSNWKTGTWTWKRVAAASGSASPSANERGTYGRFRYVPALNAFIVVNSVSSPVYMYKLSAAGGSTGGTPPSVSLTAEPNSIAAGGSTTLNWSTLNADSCTASGAWSGSRATSGSSSFGPLNATTTYTLSCTGSGGTTTGTATVQVVASGPTISFSASPATVSPNGTSVLSWSASNATSCTASGAWSGTKSTSGTQSVGPLSASATYTLSCTGSGGTNQRSASVTVQDQSQTNNFQARCAGAGVLQCVGFDSSADFSSSLAFPSGDGQVRPVLDPNVKASGNGAMRFDIPSNSGANSSGYWLGSLGKDFGPGDTLYFQFRQRFSQSMLSTNFEPGAGWKQFILHPAGMPSCTTLQFVMLNQWLQGFPTMYASCGSLNLHKELSDGDIRLQQGDVDCRYRGRAGCMKYRPDEWITFYFEMKLGAFGSPSTHIKAWMGYEGESLKQIVDFPDFRLDYDSSSSERLQRIQITPYHTGKDASQSHPTAQTWYDELIVSTQPIPAPTGTVVAPPPAATPPTVNLSAQPASVSSGGTTTLAWSTTNAETCTASGGWSGSRAASGSAAVGPITQATSFTLQCFNSVGDSESRTVQVTVAQSAPPPAIEFYADPASVELGQSSMVYWSVTNAYSCVGEKAWSGDKGTVGSEPMFLSATRTYDLVCTGTGGTSRKSATIQVVSPGQPTLTLRANSPSIQQGTTGVVTWSTTNVNNCQASGAWSGARAPSGSETVGPLNASSTFSLVCTGAGGTVEAATFIAVTAAPGGGNTGGGDGGGDSDGGDGGGASGEVPGTGSSSGGGISATGPLDLLLGLAAGLAALRRRRVPVLPIAS